MRNYDQAPSPSEADQDEPFLTDGMVRIGNRDREWVAKGTGRLWERDVVLAEIGGCLGWIPGEAKRHAPKLVRRRFVRIGLTNRA